MAQTTHNIIYNVETKASVSTGVEKTIQKIADISKKIDNINTQSIKPKVSGETTSNLDKLSKKVSDISANIKDKMQGMTDGLAGMAGNIPMIGNMLSGVITSLGPVGLVVAGVVAGIGMIGVKLFELSDDIEKTKNNFRGFADSEATLTKLTNSSRALAKSFEDFEPQVYADNVKVLASEFGVSQQEANKLLETVTKISGNKIDPDNVREYATQFSKLGLTANEFGNALVNQKALGIYMDKGVDSVKEFGLRMNKMSDAGKLAFNNVGINIDQMAKKVNQGKLKMGDALAEIGAKMGKAGKANKQLLTTEAFGAPGEDAGKQLDKYLQSFGKAQAVINKADQERFDRNKARAEQEERTTKNLNIIGYKFMNIMSKAGTAVMSVLEPFAKYFYDIFYEIEATMNEIFGGEGMSTAFDTIKDIASAVLDVFTTVFKFSMKIVKVVATIGKELYKFFGDGENNFLKNTFVFIKDSMTWLLQKAMNLVEIFGSVMSGMLALKRGDISSSKQYFGNAKDNLKALFGDEEAKKKLSAREKAILEAQAKDKADYEIKAKAESDKKEKGKASSSNLGGDISSSLTSSVQGNQGKINNITISFEALQKIMGNQVIGEKEGRKILDDMNEGFMQILNNSNQIINR